MSKLHWSVPVGTGSIEGPPQRIAAADFDPRERAYPFADRKLGDKPYAGSPFVLIDRQSVTFIGQRGPINEVGVNGCQIDDMATFLIGTLEVLNKKFPCRENSIAITKFQEGLMWLTERRHERQGRGAEGYDKE